MSLIKNNNMKLVIFVHRNYNNMKEYYIILYIMRTKLILGYFRPILSTYRLKKIIIFVYI